MPLYNLPYVTRWCSDKKREEKEISKMSHISVGVSVGEKRQFVLHDGKMSGLGLDLGPRCSCGIKSFIKSEQKGTEQNSTA